MPFFEQLEAPTTKNTTPSPEDLGCAKTLIENLTQHRMVTGRPNPQRLAGEFRLLRKTVGLKRIANALGWYCLNLRTPYTPMAYSAAAFRRKFIQIEAAMERQQTERPATGGDPAMQAV